MKLLLPLILLVVGTAAGAGAGFFLKPAPEPEEMHDETAKAEIACAPGEGEMTADLPVKPIEVFEDGQGGTTTEPEYVALEKQFVVPVITNEKLVGMMVVSLAVSVPPGQGDSVSSAEPRLRDKFLQVMFNHANVGGFSGNFTSTSNMRILRQDLLRVAPETVGNTALDVLVLDIARQET